MPLVRIGWQHSGTLARISLARKIRDGGSSEPVCYQVRSWKEGNASVHVLGAAWSDRSSKRTGRRPLDPTSCREEGVCGKVALPMQDILVPFKQCVENRNGGDA